MGYRYRVYVSRRGNLFMAELARLMVAGISDLGREAVVVTDGLPARERDNINLVVAPHEFFPLQRGHSEKALLDAAAASVAISTEQPGTPWFELGQRFSRVGPCALDINEQAVSELRGRGIDARRLPLGYHPSWDCWGGEPNLRPTDILFLGALTDRRGTFFARAAPQLWDYRCDLRFFDFRVPQAEQSDGFAGGMDKWDKLAATKVLLNVHRDELQYFEWVRILEAIANGCLVISEPSIDHLPLVAGQHFLQVPLEHIADYTVAVLADPALRDEMAAEAYDFVRSKLVFTDMLEPLLDQLEHESTGPRIATPVSSWRKPTAPRPAARGPADPPVVTPMLQPAVRARIKDMMLDEIGLLRRLEAMHARLRYGSAEYATDETTPAFYDVEPDATVVVSLYNYEQHIAEAIDSVVKSSGWWPIW